MDIFIVILCVLFALANYIFVRNFFVAKFRHKIIDLCYKHNCRRIDDTLDGVYACAFDWFLDKYSYEQFLFSFRPLKLEYWWTKEEIEKLIS